MERLKEKLAEKRFCKCKLLVHLGPEMCPQAHTLWGEMFRHRKGVRENRGVDIRDGVHRVEWLVDTDSRVLLSAAVHPRADRDCGHICLCRHRQHP